MIVFSPRFRRFGVALGLVLGLCSLAIGARAAETIPPAPAAYFNDFAGVVQPSTVATLNRELEQFERVTSNQIVVAIYPHMQSDSSIDDYSVRVYQAWHIGQKDRNNGALLLVFTQDHKIRIATGYGLEGALPDALCRRIIGDDIAPQLRAGDFDAGMTVGVHAIMAATRGEYHGTGHTANDGGVSIARILPSALFIIIVIMIVASNFSTRRAAVYGRRGRRVWVDNSPWWGGFSGGGGGGGFGGGGGGGFGGFSGGGGSTGGGGASGSW